MLQNLGAIGFVFKGDWVSGQTYTKLNVVNYNGSLYGATDTVNGTPGVDVRWAIMLANPVIPGSNVREALTADRTYYVRTNGSDSNDGMGTGTTRAFATVQKALDQFKQIDTRGFSVTIDIGTGTWKAMHTVPKIVGGGILLIRGAGTSSTILEGKDEADGPGRVFLSDKASSGITIQNLHLAGSVYAITLGNITLTGDVKIGHADGVPGFRLIHANYGGQIYINGNIEVVGSSKGLFFSHEFGGMVINMSGKTLTFTDCTFTDESACIEVSNDGFLVMWVPTYVGTFTGMKGIVRTGGSTNLTAAQLKALPGSSDATEVFGGVGVNKVGPRVRFIGSTGAINASSGVSSVTRNGVGDYTINFSYSMGATVYATLAEAEELSSSAPKASSPVLMNRTATTCRVLFFNSSGVSVDPGNVQFTAIYLL